MHSHMGICQEEFLARVPGRVTPLFSESWVIQLPAWKRCGPTVERAGSAGCESIHQMRESLQRKVSPDLGIALPQH